MIVRLMDIIGYHIFKGEHPLRVHVPGSCNKVFLIGILAGKLEADQMTAVIDITALHAVILLVYPPRRLYLADALPVFCGHCLFAYAGLRLAASSHLIQFTVLFKRHCRKFVVLKLRLVVIDLHIRLPAVLRHIFHCVGSLH